MRVWRRGKRIDAEAAGSLWLVWHASSERLDKCANTGKRLEQYQWRTCRLHHSALSSGELRWLTTFSKEHIYCANSYLSYLDRVSEDTQYEFVISEVNNFIAMMNFRRERFVELKQRVQGRTRRASERVLSRVDDQPLG
jgi:hypothetical protein